MWSVCLMSSDLQEQAGNIPSCGTIVLQEALRLTLTQETRWALWLTFP